MSRLVSFRAASFAALLVAVACAGGCFKAEAKTTVTKNGSGTFVTTMTLDVAALKQMAELMKGMAEGLGGVEGAKPPEKDPLDEMTKDFEADAIKKKLEGKKGVTLVSSTKEFNEDKTKITFRTEVKFDSLQALVESGVREEKPGTVTKLEEADGVWTYSMSVVGDDGLAMIADMFKDFSAKLIVVVPGEIEETNGTKSGSEASWTIDAENYKKMGELKTLVIKFKAAEDATLEAFTFTTPEPKIDVPAGGDGAPPVK